MSSVTLIVFKKTLSQKRGVKVGNMGDNKCKIMREMEAADPSKPIYVPCLRGPKIFEKAATQTAVVNGLPILHMKKTPTAIESKLVCMEALNARTILPTAIAAKPIKSHAMS